MIRKLKKYGVLPTKKTRVYWCSCTGNKNFGDVLAEYLAKKITFNESLGCSKHCLRQYYAITGSILGLTRKNAIIWGSGIIRKNEKIRKPKEVFAVRGPLTRKRLLELGHSCPQVYGDPALLLPFFYKPLNEKRYSLGIIPHYLDYKKVKREKKNEGILVINLKDPIEKVIEEINLCERTISSSLHGLIVSHAYGIPSLWVKFSDNLPGDGIKFKDYLLSVNIFPYKPFDMRRKIPPKERIVELIRKNHKSPSIDTRRLWESCPLR